MPRSDIAGASAVRQVLRDVLEADRKPDGELRQDNVFRYVADGVRGCRAVVVTVGFPRTATDRPR